MAFFSSISFSVSSIVGSTIFSSTLGKTGFSVTSGYKAVCSDVTENDMRMNILKDRLAAGGVVRGVNQNLMNVIGGAIKGQQQYPLTQLQSMADLYGAFPSNNQTQYIEPGKASGMSQIGNIMQVASPFFGGGDSKALATAQY